MSASRRAATVARTAVGLFCALAFGGNAAATEQRTATAVVFDLPAGELAPGQTVRGKISLEGDRRPDVIALRVDPAGALIVPSEVPVRGKHAEIEIRAARPSEDTAVVLYAGVGGDEAAFKLLVRRQPWRVVAVTTSPRRVTGGASVTGTVHVSGMTEDTLPARLELESMSPFATVPPAVEVRWGSRVSRARFVVETAETDTVTVARIVARGSGGERSWDLRVEPLVAVDMVLEPPLPPPGTEATVSVKLSDNAPADTRLRIEAGPEGIAIVPPRITLKKGEKSASFLLTRPPGASAGGGWLRVTPERFPTLSTTRDLGFDASPAKPGKTPPAAE